MISKILPAIHQAAKIAFLKLALLNGGLKQELILKTTLIPFFILMAGCSATEKSICVKVDCLDSISYPQDTISLNSMLTLGQGDEIKKLQWENISGPNTPVIKSANSSQAFAEALKPGTYIFSLTATSKKGAVRSAYDTVIVLNTGSNTRGN